MGGVFLLGCSPISSLKTTEMQEMKESWQNLTDLITNPSTTFARLKFNPKWVFAFVVFCLLSFGMGGAVAPFTRQLLVSRSVESAVPNEIPSVISVMVIALVWAVLWCVVLSVILTIAARIFKIDRAVQFKHIYAGVVHTSLIRSMIFLVNIGLLPIFRSVEDVETVIDTRIIPGVHILAGSIENANLLLFLSHVHILNIWHIFVLTIAVSIYTGVSKGKACFAAVIIWLLRVGIEVVFTAMFLS